MTLLDALANFFTLVHALRWVLVVLGFIAAGAIVAAANARADQAEKNASRWKSYAVEVEHENDSLRASLRRRMGVSRG